MPQSHERLRALQMRMKERGVDLAALGPTANMRYLLGFTPHPDERLCLLLVGADSVRMVVPGLNAEDAATHTDIELVKWADADGPSDALHSALADMRAPRTVAIDGAMRADFLLHLQQAAPPANLVPTDSLIAPLRQCKSREEIQALARAAAQADRAMQAAMDACKPGATEAEVAWTTEAAFRQDGAEAVDFTLIASGPNGAYPHHHAGPRPLQQGDAVIIDIGATLDGYKSDITRMVSLGKPSQEVRKAYDAVLEANRRAMATVRPGVTTGDIDRAARSSLESAGYGQYFIHRTGHGLGLEGHEPPWIMAGDTMVLQEGMVFSIEPGVYMPGNFGIRIEDIVAITAAGVQNLTGYDHTLVVKT
jgi:Xaa-Pro aminopeptidase